MATNEPMTTERIYEIDALWVFLDETEVDEAQDALRELLIEVRRLRAREQALEAENAAAIDELEWQRDINQQLGQENEQKQTMIDAMRLVVEAVAADLFINIDTYERCGWRDGCRPVWSEHFAEWRHAPDCPVTQARAYVAAHPSPTTAAGEAVADR